MGNSSGKSADALREAVHVLLEAPLSSGAAAGSSGVPRGDAVGRQEGGGGDEEDEPDEEELLLRDVFGGGVTDDKAFFEAFSVSVATDMCTLQPSNLKMLARKALSNISRFMEARDPGPPKETLLASVRVLTRAFPAMLSEPALRKWCWERRSLRYLLGHLDEDEEEQRRRQRTAEELSGDSAALETRIAGGNNSAGDKGVPVPVEAGGEGESGADAAAKPEENAPGDVQGQAKEDEKEGGGGGVRGGQEAGDEDGEGAGGDFKVCFASVVLHMITSLLSFPGFAIGEEALDWDDYYTPIPDPHYGIRKACVIWAPGVAVTDQNMRQVTFLDSNRIEALRLLTVVFSLPLFLDTPPMRDWRRLDTDTTTKQSAGGDRKHIPGVPLRNPLTALATSRHMRLATELFYSLLNLAVVGGSTYRGGAPALGTGTGLLERVGLLGLVGGGGSGGGSGGGRDGGPQSLVECSLQVLALLLRHGRPYGELLEKRGVSLAATGAQSAYGSIPRKAQMEIEADPGYNCYRRCVFMIHSDEDLDAIALGLLRLLNDARLGKHRPDGSVLSCHPEALMILSAFVHENARFVPRLAGSDELARGTVVCLCHFLETAVGTMVKDYDSGDHKDRDDTVPHEPPPPYNDKEPGGVGERITLGTRGGKHPLAEDVGLLVLVSRLLFILSESEHFMAMLVDTPVAGRRGEFSSPEIEAGASEGAVTLIETLLAVTSWSMSRAPEGVSLAAPALAAVARNACPFLTAGMRRNTADWLLDALEIHLSAQASRSIDAVGGAGRSPSLAVASLLLEGLAAAAAFHHAEQDELVEALTKRYTEAARVRTPPPTPATGTDGQEQEEGGVLRWLASRGGMLEEGHGAVGSEVGKEGEEQGRGFSPFADETWFRVSEGDLPWEGWAMRQVLWPLVSRLVGPTANGSPSECHKAASALMASARKDVLRPVGLCPPWSEEEGEKIEDHGSERKSDAGAAGGGRASSRSTAAVSDPSLVESGLQMPKDHSDAAAAANATASRAVLGLPSESEGVAGEEGVEDEQVEVQGIGGGMVVGVGPAGFTGGLARPARVLIVEEPWQSIYLWSVVFVRTAWDVRLFDTRTVRLFEVVDDEEEEQEVEEGDSDFDSNEDTMLREGMIMMTDSEKDDEDEDGEKVEEEEGDFVLSEGPKAVGGNVPADALV